ncbi:DUF2764 family protein [Acetobacteroides hydrogenigenes]|uniref:Uncharacterized protein DUF2764 n=1 Tax=Acetobacteroides hydrogenigenes TaxID=979970 RepID=A0A4R2E5F4_9BACT|nr:DUF2764 family protein [Acetobacteroides hydrogenigenes]TCN62717.1 uncharacterized protein DUF2764 [Acetobacteroides hydrogenigenes]
MIQNQYYYLVAGLPELFFEADNRKLDFVSIRDWLKQNLEGNDLELIDTLSLHYDNDNVLSFINNRNTFSERGLVPRDVYDDVKSNLKQFPSYIADFFTELYTERDEEVLANEDEEELQKSVEVGLYNRFYDYVASYNNEFLQKWFCFDRQLRNILAATNARKLGKEVAPILVGNDSINVALSHSQALDFGMRGELPLMDKLMPILEISNLFEREKKIDMLRWDFIDEANIFNYFNIDKVMGYLLKAEIIDRWVKFDPVLGDALLKKYFNELKGTFDLNAAFEEQ